MKKRILSLVMLICISMSLFGVMPVSAYTGTKYGNYLYYEISDGTITITGCEQTATEIEIPSTIDGYSVTSIGDFAFYQCRALISVTIPNSVTNIGYAALKCNFGLNIYYDGTEAEWYNVQIGNDNELFAVKIHYSDDKDSSSIYDEDIEYDDCPFADVTSVDWFCGNVNYVVENGLMNGISDTEFAPNDNLTRAMLVTILYRAESEPAVNKSIPFADVTADSYYANAVVWAEQNGIVSGVNENEFAPDENITREQIAAIVYRYANYKEYDTISAIMDDLPFDDADEISDYAIHAIVYAVASGLINGKTETTLNPTDTATRAEVAAILQRFIEANK